MCLKPPGYPAVRGPHLGTADFGTLTPPPPLSDRGGSSGLFLSLVPDTVWHLRSALSVCESVSHKQSGFSGSQELCGKEKGFRSALTFPGHLGQEQEVVPCPASQ